MNSKFRFVNCRHSKRKKFKQINDRLDRQEFNLLRKKKDVSQPTKAKCQKVNEKNSEIKGRNLEKFENQVVKCPKINDLWNPTNKSKEKSKSVKNSKDSKRGSILRGA